MVKFRDTYKKNRSCNKYERMEDQLLILKTFPLLVPHNKEFTFYDGFINIKNTEFRVSLNVPQYPALTDMQLQCSWEMSALLRGKGNDVLQLTKSCSTLHSFLEALQNLISEQMGGNQGMCHVNTAASMRVVDELAAVNPWCISQLSVAQQRVILVNVDATGRQHYLTVSGIGEPMGPRVSADLPHQAMAAIRAKSTSVMSLYRAFCLQVASLQKFWSIMSNVDSSCWIIDPEESHLSDTSRRIIIGENISVQLDVNPWEPSSRPDIKFLGPEKTVSMFREKLMRNLEEWDPERSLTDNLKSTLEIENFPEKSISTDECDTSLMVRPGECFVCFSVRLEGSLPSEACSAEQCGSIFHKDCLYQLLMSLPDSHRSFNRINGECPNCSTAISCTIPG